MTELKRTEGDRVLDVNKTTLLIRELGIEVRGSKHYAREPGQILSFICQKLAAICRYTMQESCSLQAQKISRPVTGVSSMNFITNYC